MMPLPRAVPVDRLSWRWKRLMRRIRYAGRGRFCPICNRRVSGFRPAGRVLPSMEALPVIGVGRREDDKCPVCGGGARHRLIFLWLERERSGATRPWRTLHFAPEASLAVHLARRPDLEYHAADIDPKRIRHLKNVLRLDITDIDCPDTSFDLVIASHVLEHVADDRRAMRALHRILRPGGAAILPVPYSEAFDDTREDSGITSDAARTEHYGQADHVRLYALADYVRRLEKAGFTVELFDPRREDPQRAEKLALHPHEKLIVGRR